MSFPFFSEAGRGVLRFDFWGHCRFSMRMKHAGEARSAGFKIIIWTLLAIVVMVVMAFLGKYFATLILFICPVLFVLWALFSIFTLYFFRDPDPRTPTTAGIVVSPGHGKVDVVD